MSNGDIKRVSGKENGLTWNGDEIVCFQDQAAIT